MVVVDASVAAKWFLQEEGTNYASQILEQYDYLVAPELIRIEVLSAITKAVRTNRIELKEAQRHCQSWKSVVEKGLVTMIPDNFHLENATKLSFELVHSIQDCLYLAAAKESSAPLATLDKKMRQKAEACGIETIDFSQSS
jgi:predicted nucleic acid-binding protein